jgi:uncharacterized membrane protein YeaQ/YmgE (transglycosylase-associated protein family)
MHLIWFVVIGILAGFLAGKVVRGRGFGVIGDLIVGVVGAWIGGHVLGWLGIVAGGTVGGLITAVVGAVILLWAIRLIKHA